jgi:hypothetical protein
MLFPALFLLLAAAEQPPVTLSTVSLSDAGFSAEVLGLGSAKVSESEAGSRDVSFSIGTKNPVSCIVHNKLVPVGLQLTDVIKAMISRKLLVRDLKSEISKYDGTLLARVFISYGKEGEEGTGLMRLSASARYDGSFLCYLDGGNTKDGFAASMERLSKTFKAKTSYPYGTPTEARLSLQRVKTEASAFGYIEAIKSVLPTGDKVRAQYAFKVLPLENAGFVFVDSLSFARYDGNGEIVKEKIREWANGQQQAEIELAHEAGKDFEYAGRIRDKNISGHIKAEKQAYFSWETQQRDIVGLLLSKKKTSLSYVDWSPQRDPAKFSTLVYTLEGDRSVKQSAGEAVATLNFDDQGDVVSSSFTLGGAEVITSREVVKKL